MTYRPGLLAASLLSLALSSPARAEGPETPPDWTGLYFGAAIATAQGDNNWRVEGRDDLEMLPGPWEHGVPVLSLGHDWQRGSLTFGGSLSLNTGVFTASPADGVFFTCVDCQTEISHLILLRGRAGYATEKTLFFASGGLARADVLATNVGGAVMINDDSLGGWTLGIGAERRIGDILTLAVSYDHVDLGALDLSDYLTNTTSDIQFDQVQVGMNVRW